MDLRPQESARPSGADFLTAKEMSVAKLGIPLKVDKALKKGNARSFYIGAEVIESIRRHPEVNWSEFVATQIKQAIAQLESSK